MTELYILNCAALDIEEALTEVSEMRREKALRYRNDGDKRQSLAAAILMRKVLGTDEYDTLQNGKPVMDGVHFSLSHSGDRAVLAVSDVPVGVDAERERKCDRRLAERFFTREECDALADSDLPDALFTRLWTKKESCLKCTGEGIAKLSELDCREFLTQSFTFDGCHISVSTKEYTDIDMNIHDLSPR